MACIRRISLIINCRFARASIYEIQTQIEQGHMLVKQLTFQKE